MDFEDDQMFAAYALLLWLLCVKLVLVMLMMMKKINQQNLVSFSVTSVIREVTSLRVDWALT